MPKTKQTRKKTKKNKKKLEHGNVRDKPAYYQTEVEPGLQFVGMLFCGADKKGLKIDGLDVSFDFFLTGFCGREPEVKPVMILFECCLFSVVSLSSVNEVFVWKFFSTVGLFVAQHRFSRSTKYKTFDFCLSFL